MSYRIALLLFLWSALACNREGRVRFKFLFDEMPAQPIWFTLKLEQRDVAPNVSENRLLSAGGPVLFTGDDVEIRIKVSNGKNRVAIAEGRAFPGLDSPVSHYGLSEPFEAAPGIDIEVPIFVQLVQTPNPPADGPGVYIETNERRGFVNAPHVDLVVITDRGVAAKISNDRTFPEDERTLRVPLTETATDADLASGFAAYRIRRWDLELGQKEPCPVPGLCSRELYVRTTDKNNYDSIIVSDRAWLDTEPPILRDETLIEPRSASPTTRIKVTLVASEVLRGAPTIIAESAGGLTFERLLPANDGPSNTYTYLSNTPGAASLPDGEYTLRTELVDLAGNTNRVEIGTVVLDGVAPSLSALELSPKRIGSSGDVFIRCMLGEELADAQVEVTFGGARVERCTRNRSAPNVRLECVYSMRGDEIAPDQQGSIAVRVFAVDEALNQAALEDTIIVDFHAPVLDDIAFYPSPASIGTRAALRVTTAEALREAPRLTWSNGQDPGFTLTGSISSSTDQLFHASIGAAVPDGVFELETVELVDVVGNRRLVDGMSDLRLPLAFVVDKSEPRIEGVAVDVDAAALQLPETSPPRINAAPGRRVRIRFSVSDPHLDPSGTRVFIGPLDVTSSCTSTGRGETTEWTCLYFMTGAETPGFQAIDIRAADLAGNRAGNATAAAVIFDFEAPSVSGSPLLTLVPNATNPLLAVSRVKEGTTIELRFEMNEETAEAPTVTAGTTTNPSMFAFTNQPRAGSVLLYTHTLAPTTQQGVRTFRVTARDLAGNTSPSTAIAGVSFRVDTIAPSSPAVDTADLIVLERRPWGDATNANARLTLSGGAGSVEANATVIISSPYGSNPEIGRVLESANGGFPAIDLNFTDAPTLRLEAVDTAGNVSAPVTVRDGLWIASPRATSPNPNRLRVSVEAQETLDQSPYAGIETEASAAQIAAASLTGDGAYTSTAATPMWRRLEPGVAQPSARSGHGLAYDTKRGRTVLFGGNDGTSDLDDTWEHDGVGWNVISPAAGIRPSARQNPHVVYDARRECTFLYGGRQGSTDLNDVWCFDGRAWTELTSNAPFSARADAAIGYHGDLGLVVLFGGRSVAGDLNETWTWDGTSWAQMPIAGAPSVRSSATMAFYPGPIATGTGRLILYGGRSGSTVLDETWSWSGSWTQLSPTARPPRLRNVGLATDPTPEAQPRLVLFGGYTLTGARSPAVWTWDGAQWTPWTAPISGPAPGARITPIVYDARNDLIVAFGGEGSSLYRDTWARSSQRWTELTVGIDRPSARHRVAMSSTAQVSALFGGADTFDDRAWSLRGSTWDQHLSTGPTAREGATLTGLSGGAFVLFGGIQGSARSPETWLWTSPIITPPGGWFQLAPVLSPERRDGHRMVRITNNRALLFGGETNGGFSDETWLWDSNAGTWTPRSRCLAQGSWPSARADHAMVYDARGNRVLLFGGRDSQAAERADLWEWSVASNTCWTMVPVSGLQPRSRRRAVFVDDVDRGRLVLFGGESGSSQQLAFLSDTWGLTTSTTEPWIYLTTSPTSIGPHSGAGGAYDPARGQVLIVGGEPAATPYAETWVLARGEAHRPSVRFTVAWDFASVDAANIEQMTIVAHGGGRGYSRSLSQHRDGSALRIWDVTLGRWWTMRVNLVGPGAPGLLMYDLPGDYTRRHISESGTIDVMVTSTLVDYGAERAQVAVDDIEVRLKYRL